MNAVLLFLVLTSAFYGLCGRLSSVQSRQKRDAAGTLAIVTNHALPIHADVNSDLQTTNNEKPCPKNKGPSKIEPGIVFQVVSPSDTFIEVKSLRKSNPVATRLDLIRGVSRTLALAVVIFSAAVEFYPVVVHVYNSIYDFFYLNKY